MAEFENEAAPDDVDEIRQQLLRRIGIAGTVIVALIGGLTFLDTSKEAPPPTAPQEVAVAPVTESAKPVTPAPAELPPLEPEMASPDKAIEAPPVSPVQKPTSPIKPITPKPVGKQTAAAPAVAEPERTSLPETPPLRNTERPLTKPATAQAVSTGVPEKTQAAAPPVRNATAHPQPVRPLTSAAESVRRYVVQMGVFNTLSNAEELHAKLQKAGIPSQIEARVQAGPFANRAEAEAAQKKMAELGLNSGILIAPGK